MFPKRCIALLPLICVLIAATAQATMVKRMDLEQMAESAGLIFRGTVVKASKGSIQTGGRSIPIVTYQIRVAACPRLILILPRTLDLERMPDAATLRVPEEHDVPGFR